MLIGQINRLSEKKNSVFGDTTKNFQNISGCNCRCISKASKNSIIIPPVL